MSVRANLKALLEQAKEKELWILVYWEDENSVSVHRRGEVKAPPIPTVGSDCVAMFRGKEYTGQIGATGSKQEMVNKMNLFYKGKFTPFEESTSENSSNQTEQQSSQKSTSNTNEIEQQSSQESTSNTNKIDQQSSQKSTSKKSSDQTKQQSSQGSTNTEKRRKRKLVDPEKDSTKDTRDQASEAAEPSIKKSKGSREKKGKKGSNKTAGKTKKPTATKKGKQKAKGSILTVGSGGGLADESDLESEGALEISSDDESKNDGIEEGRGNDDEGTGFKDNSKGDDNRQNTSNAEGQGQGSSNDERQVMDASVSKVAQDSQLASVLKRVAKLEKQNDTIKQELFEMEARLLKVLSDNKMYVLRKVKEFKVLHEKPYQPERSSVHEATRQVHDTAESTRQVRDTAESTRQVRDTAESTRQVRDTAEPTRQVRDTAESTRQVRDTAESTRQVRDTAESTRQVRDTAESTRQVHDTAESTRQVRNTAESTRQVRDTAESTRQVRDTAESTRQVRDTTDSTTESTREVRDTAEATCRQVVRVHDTTSDMPSTSYEDTPFYDEHDMRPADRYGRYDRSADTSSFNSIDAGDPYNDSTYNDSYDMTSDSYNLLDHSGFQTLHGSQYCQGQYGPSGTVSQPRFIPLHPDQVVEKYPQLKTPSGMSRLAVKLARESFFGEKVMGLCTPQGRSDQDKLPREPLLRLKLYLVRLFPSLSNADFEGYWKTCLTSIGQACKSIRNKKK